MENKMKLPVSDKKGNSYTKPLIRKGYYPGKLLKVEPFLEKDGSLREGKYGHQLIMEFAVYEGELDTGKPIRPILFEGEPVKLSKFVYYEYKDRENPNKYQTAITPNSAITKLLVNLGWTFSKEDVDIEQFIGKWAELNIDEYKYTIDGTEFRASTISNVGKYEGPTIKEDIENVEPSKKPEKVEKQVKHEDVSEKAEIREKLKQLEKLNKDGLLTDEGLAQSKEKLEADLESLD